MSMRLFVTPTSPFARKVLVLAHERGLIGQLNVVDARIRTPQNEVLAVSPLGKVPTLVTKDVGMLTDSTVICTFLDEYAEGPMKWHAQGSPDKWRQSRLASFAEGLLESLAWRTRELRRPEAERSPSFLTHERSRQTRCYDHLERSDVWLDEKLHMGHLTLAIALDYGIYRFPEEDWRSDRPRLAQWFDDMTARPSFVMTRLPPQT